MLKMTAVTAALLACVLGPTAGAATTDEQFGAALNAIFTQCATAGQEQGKAATKSGQKQAAENAGYKAIKDVMIAMNDAPGTGEMVVQWLRDNNVTVDFSADAAVSSHEMGAKSAIHIPAQMAAPDKNKMLGALIAREASEMMMVDFPDSAEKNYIVASRMAEVYFELGGTRDGMKTDAKTSVACNDAAKTMGLWIDNGADQGVGYLKAAGAATLSDLIAAYQKYPEYSSQDTALKNATTAFASFKKYESDWMVNHQGMLQ